MNTKTLKQEFKLISDALGEGKNEYTDKLAELKQSERDNIGLLIKELQSVEDIPNVVIEIIEEIVDDEYSKNILSEWLSANPHVITFVNDALTELTPEHFADEVLIDILYIESRMRELYRSYNILISLIN